jgi:hypothetical protein
MDDEKYHSAVESFKKSTKRNLFAYGGFIFFIFAACFSLLLYTQMLNIGMLGDENIDGDNKLALLGTCVIIIYFSLAELRSCFTCKSSCDHAFLFLSCRDVKNAFKIMENSTCMSKGGCTQFFSALISK